ncbi:MAG: YibE/F family protein, partial [Desulfobacterales bacterium]|nr:YibE/F family protein [Desulfobacterales bacterium]
MTLFSDLQLGRNLPVLVTLILICLGLAYLPNPYYRGEDRAVRCRGEILSVDNSQVHQLGMIRKGNQSLRLKIESGPFQGRIFSSSNQLRGQLDRDKLFAAGDRALVVLSLDREGRVIYVLPQAHYRLGYQFFLFALFAGGLVLFGGWTGVRSLFSFMVSGLMIWKVLVPLFLNGV